MFDVCQVYHVGICIYRYQKPDVWSSFRELQWRHERPGSLAVSSAVPQPGRYLPAWTCVMWPCRSFYFSPRLCCCPVVTIPCDKRNSYPENQWIGLTFTGHPQLFNIFHGENAWTCMVYCRCFPSINPLREGFWAQAPPGVSGCTMLQPWRTGFACVVTHIHTYIYSSIRQHNIT